ncbi:MAG TPA: 2'-5' RNA ligase family protein [Bryobacteraceae bacterium]|jgi:2'-5' RNA ligase|nr:2'-5' RNA ligase family protein [Bryobacteraceae bacterium]
MTASPWGAFALVSYVPDPLGSLLDNFRHSVSGSDQAQAHVTLLPPRALRVPLETASEQAASTLRAFSPFEVELDAVHRFPVTNVLYLGISCGSNNVRELHRALNTAGLAAHEQFDFQPHLTLGGPFPEPSDAAEASVSNAWSKVQLSKRFLMDEIVALWANPLAAPQESWTRVWTYNLRRAHYHTHAAAIGRTS